MEILNLTLSNFRNFSSKKFVFDKGLTVIIGPNGAGKSNILEAISLICGMRPTHVESDLDLIRFGKSEARIESKVESSAYTEVSADRQSVKKTLTVNFQVVDERFVKKSYLIDGFRKRFANFLEILSIVVFHPEDLDLVAGSPSLRRHHLDIILSSCDRDYWRNISAYNKVVTRRNRVLNRIGEGRSKPLELKFWDLRLLEHGKYISKKREEFIEFLDFVESVDPVGRYPQPTSSLQSNPDIKSKKSSDAAVARWGSPTPVTHGNMMKGYSWELKQSLITEEKLLRNRERDIAAGVTLSGPHRDDFRFMFRGRDLAYFGSRGEQRMAVLALKLSELEYLRVQRGKRPILALDDIFSELDWEHREMVLAVIGNQQTIITAAEKESVPKKLLKKAKIIEL